MTDLLSDLLKDAVDQGHLKKKKKSDLSMSRKREEYVHIPFKDRFESVALVMINHTTKCDCCHSTFTMPNKPLVKRVNPKGDIHYKENIDRKEFDTLPREVEVKEYSVESCPGCFHSDKWYKKEMPVETNPDALITSLINEVENNENEL